MIKISNFYDIRIISDNYLFFTNFADVSLTVVLHRYTDISLLDLEIIHLLLKYILNL